MRNTATDEHSANPQAHYKTSGPEIAKMSPNLDVVFTGSGTIGTLTGCAQYFREFRPEVKNRGNR